MTDRRNYGKGGEGARRTKSERRAEAQNVRLNAQYKLSLEKLRTERNNYNDNAGINRVKLCDDLANIKKVYAVNDVRSKDRHIGLTREMASKRVLQPLVIEAYYLKTGNDIALRRVSRVTVPCPENYALRPMRLFARSLEMAGELSQAVKSARRLTQTMDQERMFSKLETARQLRQQRLLKELSMNCSRGSNDGAKDEAAPSLMRSYTDPDVFHTSTASSKSMALAITKADLSSFEKEMENAKPKRLLRPTKENGQMLVDRATRKMAQFLYTIEHRSVTREASRESQGQARATQNL